MGKRRVKVTRMRNRYYNQSGYGFKNRKYVNLNTLSRQLASFTRKNKNKAIMTKIS